MAPIKRYGWMLPLLFAATTVAVADMVPMRDYIQLQRGMSEAEVLYRVGPSDYESVATDHHHNILEKTWYYIPARATSSGWITEIKFDHRGLIESLERYRVRR